MTLTLAAVYAPIAFVGGVTGALFKEFAFTLAGAVIVSGFIALTLSPMMCSKILKSQTHAHFLQRFVDKTSDKLSDVYEVLLRGVLQIRWLIAIIMLLVLAAIAFLFLQLPQELAPKEDSGTVITIAQGPPQASLDYTEKYAKQIGDIYAKVPQGEQYIVLAGIPNGYNTALSVLQLKPWSERKLTANDIVKQLFPKLHKIVGVSAFPVNPYHLPGSSGLMNVQFVLKTSNSYSYLSKYAQQLLTEAKASGEFKNLSVDLVTNQPSLDVTINRKLAGNLGIPMSNISNALGVALSGSQFSQMAWKGRSYDVISLLQDKYRNTPAAFNLLNVRTKSGKLVPLSSLISVKTVVAPQTLNHFQQMRSATLSGIPAPGYTLGQALTELQTLAAKILPQDIAIDYSGQSRQYIQSGTTLEQAMLFALIFIFLVLSAQFESFRDAWIVLFSVPLSIFGALLFFKTGWRQLKYLHVDWHSDFGRLNF